MEYSSGYISAKCCYSQNFTKSFKLRLPYLATGHMKLTLSLSLVPPLTHRPLFSARSPSGPCSLTHPLVSACPPTLWSLLTHLPSGPCSLTCPLVPARSPTLWSQLAHPPSGPCSLTCPLVLACPSDLWSQLAHPPSGPCSLTRPLVSAHPPALWF